MLARCLPGAAAALLACGTLAPGAAQAQDAPIRMLVGFAPGGMTDMVARVLAQGLQTELGRTVVVENRAGAGGQIAAQALTGAAPDGNTLFLTNSHTTAMIPLTMKNPGYDVERDFVSVGLVATNPNFFIVNPELVGDKVDSIEDFVKWVQANPTQGNIGVPAPVSTPEFTVTALGQAYNTDLRAVAYRGDAPLVQDLLAKQLPAGITGIASALPYVETGKLKLIGVDGPTRLKDFPDIPTYTELGLKGLDDVIFIGVIAPTGTPAAMVQRYNKAISAVVGSPAFYERVSATGIVPLTGSPEDMTQRTEASLRSNAALLKAANYQPQ
ncbi:MAG: tripartite tricarboxylate transporter substrate-binding protein [Pigmentiphaga sp.]|nr:tripartite tricarboxylate transporter substrate-binding protein [Pigmentiphaga sp.]